MNIRNQLICAHSAPVWALCTGIGFFFMTGWLPPLSPALPFEELRANLTPDDTLMRLGLALAAFISPFFLGLAVAIGVQLRRLEGEYHVFSNLQLCCAAVGVLALQFPAFFWLAITYRPDLPEGVVMVFNDLSWFLLLGAAGPAVLQNFAIGICILGCKPNSEIYPRWLGYFNIWIALLLLPGLVIPFVKSGPFAWNGVFGFWMVANGFFAWFLLNYGLTLRAIYRQRDQVST